MYILEMMKHCEVSLSFYLAIFNLEVVNAFEVVKGSPSHTGLESVKSINKQIRDKTHQVKIHHKHKH